MKRRDFIFRGGAAIASVASPLASGAQSMPVIGFLSARSPVESTQLVAAFHDGLKGNGFVENQNLRIEYRWAEGQIDRLVQLASDLVNRQVTAIVAVGNTPSAYAAKAATTIIPIVFVVGDDPVKIGLVESLARPRGNLTGVTVLFGPLLLKRFEILHEPMPGTLTIALLTNQNNPITDQVIKGAQEAARRYQWRLLVQTASNDSELEIAFAKLVQQHVAALVVDADPFFGARRNLLVALAARYALPAIYTYRDFALDGGLMSYGGDLRAGYRDAGGYVGRILKGAKPSDLPVQQSTKVELVINLKTAKTLGITFPLTLLGRADDVIE